VIIGTGIDLIEIARIERIWHRFGQTFAKRLLHEQELAHLPTDPSQQVRWLAKRWAAKEAAAKALGTGFQRGITLTHFITTGHNHLGKPLLHLTGEALNQAEQLGIQAWHLSISDEKTQVIAMVIAES
jgi:holo-[acyl-carrier protein] synthase